MLEISDTNNTFQGNTNRDLQSTVTQQYIGFGLFGLGLSGNQMFVVKSVFQHYISKK